MIIKYKKMTTLNIWLLYYHKTILIQRQGNIMEQIRHRQVSSYLIAFIFTFLSFFANSQALDSKGKEFWLAFPDNGGSAGLPDLSLFLSSETDTEVSINIPSINFSDTVSLVANVTTLYTLPAGLETLTFDQVDTTGIGITSIEEVSVYGLSRYPQTTDAYLGLPVDVLGNEYMVLAWDQGVLGSSTALILATEDNTNITITPSLLDTSRLDPIEIILNRGETYQLRTISQDDMTGALISSSESIAVFAGHQCANIPDTGTLYCDHIVEQLNPLNSWGSQFFTAPLSGRSGGDTFRVLAKEDETSISVNGEIVSTIDSGEYYETLLEGGNVITTDNPVLLAQYSNSTTFDNTPNSDPFMMLISPFEQYLDDYAFSTAPEGFLVNYVNIVTKTSDIANLLLDGESLDANDFNPIDGSDYSYAQITLAEGSHNIVGALAGIYVYGFADDDSYGYPGGLSLSSVAEVENVVLDPEYSIVDDQACFNVRVSDLNNLPLEDIRVDFLVDLISGFETTDSEGVAVFCVEAGPNPGEFVVSASVGGETATGTITQEELQTADNSDEDSGGGGGCSIGYNTDYIDPTLPLMALLSLFFIIRRRNKFSK